jgi:hypothetical protein
LMSRGLNLLAREIGDLALARELEGLNRTEGSAGVRESVH